MCRTDADTNDASHGDGVHLFFVRAKAEAKWAKQCRTRHTHDHEVVPESSDGDSSSSESSDDENNSPVAIPAPASSLTVPIRASTRTKEVKQEVKKDVIPLPLYLDDPTSIVTPLPAERATSLKRTALRAQPGSSKRGKSRGAASTVRAPSTPALSAFVATPNAAPSAHEELHPSLRHHYRDLRIRPTAGHGGSPIYLRPATGEANSPIPPASHAGASSPSVSSVSSISTSSVTTDVHAEEPKLPFLDLRMSASASAPPFGGAEFGRFMRESVSARGLSPLAASGSKRSSVSISGRGADSSRAGRTVKEKADDTRLLYNSDTRTLYKDPYMCGVLFPEKYADFLKYW